MTKMILDTINGKVMKKEFYISTTIDQPGLLENLVEKLAYRRNDFGYSKVKMPVNLKAIETSSAETYASGTLAMTDNFENLKIPFITSFFFTCVKITEDKYRLTWASSMS